MKIKVIYIVLIIIWMITVFYFSNQQGEESGGTSGKVIESFMKIFSKKPTDEQIQKMQLPIRKLAHFTIYAIGGILTILLLKEYNISLIQKVIYSQLFISIYAMSDEFHQSFIPGRTATITDVLIDSVGGFTAIVLISVIFLRKKKEGNTRWIRKYI